MIVSRDIFCGHASTHIQFAQVCHPEAVIAANAQNAVDISVAEAGDAQQRFAWCGVDIHGEKFRMRFGPGQLGILVQTEVRALIGG